MLLLIKIFFLKKDLTILSSLLSVCVSACECGCPWRPEEHKYPRMGTTGGGDALCEGAGNRTQVLCLSLLSTAKSSLQSLGGLVGWFVRLFCFEV